MSKKEINKIYGTSIMNPKGSPLLKVGGYMLWNCITYQANTILCMGEREEKGCPAPFLPSGEFDRNFLLVSYIISKKLKASIRKCF